MSCKCAIETDEYHGWECSITGGACMYLTPNSKTCAKEYGEGPDAWGDEEHDDTCTDKNTRILTVGERKKDDEQEVDSPYPNTLKAIIGSFQKLAEYENTNLEPQEIPQWIKFTSHYDEEQELDMLDCEKPEEDQEILVTDGHNVWMDTWMSDGSEVYLDSNFSIGDEVTHWMPLPEPPESEK